MNGHRVVIEAELRPTENNGLKSPLREGNRSLIFIFPGEPERDSATQILFGAIVERILSGGEPGSIVRAEVWFWQDAASHCARVGKTFDLWYNRIVGHGHVVALA